jgi:hypothetical protein
MLLWLLGAVVAVVLLGSDILRPGLDRMIGRDFTNLWEGGKLVLAGEAGCAFDMNCFRIAQWRDLHMLALQNYSYPPFVLLLDAPFALMPYYLSLAVWTALGIAFFAWTARPYVPKGFSPVLAALTPAATINIWNGHYGFLLGGLWLLCFRAIDSRPGRAGIYAALLTFKPHLGVMIAATVARKWQALLTAIAGVVALLAISSAVLGPETWRYFFLGTTAVQGDVLTRPGGEFYFRMMPTAYVTFGKGMPGVVAQTVFALAAIGLLLRHRRWDAFSAATVTFLVLPYAFNYDMTVACLGYAIMLYASWSRLSWPERLCLMLAFLSPEITYMSYLAWLIPFILLGALHIQLTRIPEVAGIRKSEPQAGALEAAS